jgi:hypothetical protein
MMLIRRMCWKLKKKRLEDDTKSRTVTVEDIMLGSTTDEAAITIDPSNTGDVANLSMLAATASLPIVASKVRRKKPAKSLWTYETVLEPTVGAASKYWDTDAPPERRTKQLAKEKLTMLKNDDGDVAGLSSISSPIHFFHNGLVSHHRSQ